MSKYEEIDDYLSEQFVTEPERDVRPGLQFSHSLKRKHELHKKIQESNRRSKTKPLRVLEEERREEALNNALPEDNKGFAMLQKMGYKPGMALGRQGSSTQAPIRPVVKNDRGGLGKDEEDKREAKNRIELHLQTQKEKVAQTKELLTNYQSNVRKERMLKKMQKDIVDSQKACEQLDISKGLLEPVEKWFWRNQDDVKNEDEDSSDSGTEEEKEPFNPEEQLSKITEYLRGQHFYCIWCGVKYNDANDLSDNCPGATHDDHE